VADWDANSPALLENLQAAGRLATANAHERKALSSETVREWQAVIMRGLTPSDGEPPGRFRGEPDLEEYDVRVGDYLGARAEAVRSELDAFDTTLAAVLSETDRLIRPDHLDEDLNADTVTAVIAVGAWAHGEWVRIHPFPNGNGRTARLLVTCIALRYGLPAFLRLRPRPGEAYAWVASQAMEGNWEAAVPFFTRLYEQAL
jgi:Fic family protein